MKLTRDLVCNFTMKLKVNTDKLLTFNRLAKSKVTENTAG